MAKVAAKGSAVRWTISSVLTTIIQQTEISQETTSLILDVPSLDDGTAIDKIAGGYVNYGDIRFGGFLDPAAATHRALTSDMTSQTARAGSILWSDVGGSSWTFTGLVRSFSASAQEQQALRFNAVIAVDGAITYPT